jgi:hypothetical protein
MAFNISRFKSTIDKYGGFASPALYEVTISKAREQNSAIDPTTEFRFFCLSSYIPGIELETVAFNAVGQRAVSFPVGMSNNAINMDFFIDSDHQILSFFHNWIQKVFNYSTKGGPLAAIGGDSGGDGQLPYELGYKDDYACTMSIKHFSNDSGGEKYYEVVLENVWPYMIQDMQVGWASNDQYLSCNVTFAYDRIWYSGDKTGIPSERSKAGILEKLSSIAGLVDVLKQTKDLGKPRSIQDAINRLNRVRNSYEKVDSLFGLGG